MTKKLAVTKLFNQVVEIQSVSGGWTTFRTAEGEEGKARNSQLREPTPEEAASFGGKPTGDTPKADKPAKTAKTAKAPKPKAEKPAKAPKVKADKPKKSAKPKVAKEAANDDPQAKLQLVDPDYARYTKHDVKSPSGRKALDIADAAADLLRGQDISDCYFIVAKHMAKVKGEERDAEAIEKQLTKDYKHLNIGMQRMNLGNRLRKLMGIYGNLNAHKNAKPAKVKSAASKVSKRKPSMSISVPTRFGRRKTDRAAHPVSNKGRR